MKTNFSTGKSKIFIRQFAWLTMLDRYFRGSFMKMFSFDQCLVVQRRIYFAKLNVFTDCGFHFSSENEEDDPLRILTEEDEKAIILPSENCTINATSSMYLDCGKWLPIDETSVLNKFSLNQTFTNSHFLKASDFISF